MDSVTEYKYKKFSIVKDKIIFKNEQYSVNDVTSISFYWEGQNVRTNFVSMGEDNQVYLTIYLSNRKNPIVVKYLGAHTRKIIFEDTYTKAETLYKIYKHLAQLTFKQRLAKYVDEMDSHDYFSYAGAKFLKNSTVQLPKSNEVIDIADYRVSRTAFMIYLKEDKPEPSTIWGKVLKKVNGEPGYDFSTVADQDVLFTLLDHYFGIRWSD